MAARQRPNILVTGTPGTGKTTTCELLAAATGLRHINIGDVVKKEELHHGWDDEYNCFIIDEDKVRWFVSFSWAVVLSPPTTTSHPARLPSPLIFAGL